MMRDIRTYKMLGAAGALIFAGISIGLLARGQSIGSRLQAAAAQVMATCKDAPYRPSCYDKEIPKFMQEFSMEQTFNIVRIVQNDDPSYPYCHVLGHELASLEVKKDPTKWEEVAGRCPTDLCSNGCIHGAFQERFRSDVLPSAEVVKLAPEFANLCEAKPGFNPSGLTQASCYHAVGHLLMYVTNADIPTAVSLCGQVALKSDGRDYREVCYDGVFMQMFQPLEPEDIALVKGKVPTAAQIPSFCAKYPGAPGASCISESWPLFQNLIEKPGGASQFCGMEQSPYKERCFDATFYIVMAEFNLDASRMEAYCAASPKDVEAACFASGASRIVETDPRFVEKAVDFCALAQRDGEGDTCYGQLATHAAFDLKPNSPEFAALCEALPQSWQERCFDSAPHS